MLKKLKNNKRKSIIMLMIIIILGTISFLIYKGLMYKNITFALGENNVLNNSNMHIYIEDESGNYITYTGEALNRDDYMLNNEKSYCQYGSELEGNSETINISLKSKGEDICYIYYQIVPPTLSDTILINNSIFGVNEEASVDNAKNYISSRTKPTLSNLATTNEGMFSIDDNFGTSYYFRGAVNDNWVKFAGFYWRIIRIDGQGNTRLIYSGSVNNHGEVSSNGVYMKGNETIIGEANYYDNPKYVGYQMVDQTLNGYDADDNGHYIDGKNVVDSNIKIALDNWYKTNIEDKGYKQYVADSIFCNDRTLYNSDNQIVEWYEGGVNPFNGAVNYQQDLLTFICENPEDKFTVNTNIGNGALKYPISIITFNEAVFSGMGLQDYSTDSYLYSITDYWTLTPWGYPNSDNPWTTIIDSGGVHAKDSNDRVGIRPVISLSSDILFESGLGTWEKPYIIT